MRYLVVDHRLEKEARELLLELATAECEVMVCGKGAAADKQAAGRVPQGSTVYLVRVRRKLFKHCDVVFAFDSFVPAAPELRRIFHSGPPPPPTTSPRPVEAFRSASEECCSLILAPAALASAEELPHDRHSFCAAAAHLLKNWARTARAEPSLDAYFRGLGFCRNSRTKYTVEIYDGGTLLAKGSTEWHLKKGDHTSQAHAARIYFFGCRLSTPPTFVVAVLHVGPHPDEDCVIKIRVDLSEDQVLKLGELRLSSTQHRQP